MVAARGTFGLGRRSVNPRGWESRPPGAQLSRQHPIPRCGISSPLQVGRCGKVTSESPRRHLQIVLITIVTYGLVRTKGRCGECQRDAANERPASYRVHSCHRMGSTTRRAGY